MRAEQQSIVILAARQRCQVTFARHCCLLLLMVVMMMMSSCLAAFPFTEANKSLVWSWTSV